MTKDHARVLTQEMETLRAANSEFEREVAEKQNQLAQEHVQALSTQKQQLEATHSQTLSTSVARYEEDLVNFRSQIDGLQKTVEQLHQDLQAQEQRATAAEQLVQAEQQRSVGQKKDLEQHESKVQEVQRKYAGELQQLRTDLEAKQKLVLELQGKVIALEGNSRSEMAEKAQQVKILQQKLMTQEARLEEKIKQIQTMERVITEKEQLLTKMQQNPQIVGSTRNELQPLVSSGSLMDSEVPVIPGETLQDQRDTSDVTAQFSRAIIEDSTTPLTPTLSNKGPKYSMTVVDEAGNQSNSLNISTLDKESEQALREHYEAKMQQLASQMKASDSKAVQLFEQYSSLLKALEEKEVERNFLLDQVKVSSQAAKEVKDDLESTRTNYDAQLRMLSELTLSREEKIQSLEAENGAVKGCKVSCGKCKTWNTIEWLLNDGRGGQRCVKGNHPLSTFLV